MKFFFRNNILIAFLLICAGVIYLGTETYRSNLKNKETAFLVEHTQKVLYLSEQILSLNQDIETANRGFLLTNNEAFLHPFISAKEIAFTHLNSLKKLIEDNQVQQKRVWELLALTDKKIKFSEGVVKARKEKGFETAKAMIAGGRGMALMDSIRNLISEIQTEENRLLAIRKAANEKSNAAFNQTFIAQFVAIFFAILISGFLVFYNLKATNSAQKRLIENEHLLQSIIDNTPSHIYIKDLKGRYLLINKIYAAGIGVGNDSVEGKTVFDFFPESVATTLRERELMAINEKRFVQTQDDAPINGEMHHFLSVRYPLYNLDGTMYAVGGISTDITEIKRQADIIEDLYDHAPAGYYSLDAEGKFINANQTTCAWLGYTKEELIGKKLIEILTVESIEDFNKKFPVFKQEGALSDQEFTYIKKDKTLMPVLLNATAVKDQDGNFLFSRSTIFDITERKKLETELTQVNHELESFTYSISHDLRAPLRIITGYAGIIAEEYDKALDDDGRRMLKNININTARMGQLIDDLLNFSRLGRKDVVKHKTDMTLLVNQIAEDELKNSTAANVSVKTGDLGTAYCDSSLIKQVWQNLISNAVKYSGKVKAPVIEITAYTKDGQNHYSIKDNGAGFDMRYYDKLFGVFQRLHKADEFPGTGVGLALAQRIVNKHGGHIRAESTLNEGAIFSFSLPLDGVRT